MDTFRRQNTTTDSQPAAYKPTEPSSVLIEMALPMPTAVESAYIYIYPLTLVRVSRDPDASRISAFPITSQTLRGI